MLDTTTRTIFTEDHAIFRDSVRKLFSRALIPHLDEHERDGVVGRDFWLQCGVAGLLCPTVDPAFGGPGLDFTYNVIVQEELSYAGSHAGLAIQNDITADYIQAYGSQAQKQRYLPRMVGGECITAIAMTEPSAGSDLKAIRTVARRDGDDFIINGSKIYITNGHNADLVVLAAKTDPARGAAGMSLFLVEADTPGFVRGRKLDKIGQRSGDTAELFFQDMRVPADSLLGAENAAFGYLVTQLAQERLSVAVAAQAAAQRAFDEALAFTRQRPAFGKRVLDFQNTRFVLAGLKTELQVGWAHLDWAIARHVAGKLDAQAASAAKLWHTELQGRVVDAALQLHGGAGYMNEYMIARLYRDARVTRIYGGTSEIMKEVIGRAL
ncbi:acyl-CoA dehydrogenase family protein [Niveispirillum sp. KHB5.9]|uniref:acyl-CoA dehydrogenase family protein n=1 Tax=Niveispirillum sp. KHB5.9 TaxID=3400269 RepID=UPI003A870B23